MGKQAGVDKVTRGKPGFSTGEREQISTGITIGTGVVVAVAMVWVLYWISTESIRMMLDTVRALGSF
jgi:hypothetical protein